jgi:uncharacterized protein YdeI (YjbR/CyaY-like superfamily)
MPPPVDARFFASPEDFRRWLEENHETASELWVGYYKKGSGRIEKSACGERIDQLNPP